MKKNLTKLNGFLLVIFGLVALFFPGITIKALGIYFAITALIGGIVMTVGAVRVKKHNPNWYTMLAEGVIGILISFILFAAPQLLATVFVIIIGIWAIVLGLIFLFTYFKRTLPAFSNSFLLIVSILSLIVGAFVILDPFESTRLVTILIGIYTILYGTFSIINSSKSYSAED